MVSRFWFLPSENKRCHINLSTAEYICVTLNSCMMLPKLSGCSTRSENFSCVQCVQEVGYRSLRSCLKSRDSSRHMTAVTCTLSIISHNSLRNKWYIPCRWLAELCQELHVGLHDRRQNIEMHFPTCRKMLQRKPRDCKIYRLLQSVVLHN